MELPASPWILLALDKFEKINYNNSKIRTCEEFEDWMKISFNCTFEKSKFGTHISSLKFDSIEDLVYFKLIVC